MNAPYDHPALLRHAFAQSRQHGHAPLADVAADLGASEAALLAAHAGVLDLAAPLRAIRLRPQWPLLLDALAHLGPVQASCRNAGGELSLSGVCHPQPDGHSASGGAGHTTVAISACLGAWAHAFSVQERMPWGVQHSLHCFGHAGQALLSLTLGEDSDLDAFASLCARLSGETLAPSLPLLAQRTPALAAQTDWHAHRSALRAGWAGLRELAQYPVLLHRLGLTPLQALHLADPLFAQPVEAGCSSELLLRAAQTGLGLRLELGNAGVNLLHQGSLQQVDLLGSTLSASAAGCWLSLDERALASTWLARWPSAQGLVSALCLFDAQGQPIATLAAERRHGQPERCEWRQLLASVTQEPTHVPSR